MDKLEQLRGCSRIVSDTGDFVSIEKYRPEDATTNPSLILKAAQIQAYSPLLEQALFVAKKSAFSAPEILKKAARRACVNFGCEILKRIPGRVSTEVDARLSFDIEGTVDEAKALVALYKEAGIERERVLIKIVSTWEGIESAKILEKEGISCNLTLIFSLHQAVAAAKANVFLISPFVGRIYDWYKHKEKRDYLPLEDPGVLSLKRIYTYFHHFGYRTLVMGASFRSKGQIEAVAGCDCLTISPSLLEELQNDREPLVASLCQKKATETTLEPLHLDQKSLRWALNEDPMATEKLAEGIRLFAADSASLETLFAQRL